MPFPTGEVIGSGADLASGVWQDIWAANQNAREGRRDAEVARQLDPFVQWMEGYSADDLRGFDTGRLKNFDAGDLRDFAARLESQGGVPSVSRIGSYVDTGALSGMDTSLDLSKLRTSDTSGLEASAGRTLRRNSGALDAALASRGIFNSGAGVNAQRQLTADVYSGLAEQINADRFARENAALGFERGGQQLKAQNLAQALGLQVDMRGQDVTQRGQDVASADNRSATIADAIARATGIEADALSQGLGMDLDALGQALGLELGAMTQAGEWIRTTPGYRRYDRDTGEVDGGK